MIVESKLKVDQHRGTATLGHCCETTISGRMLSLEDIGRCLVWHSSMHFEPYSRVMMLVRQQAALIGATGVRVSDLTSTLFALGLYAPTAQGWGNPDTVVLVELDRKGQLQRAEVLGQPDSALSEQFHAHKNDLRTTDDLRALILSWRYTSLLHELTQGRLEFESRTHKAAGPTRGERAPAAARPVEEHLSERQRKQRAHRSPGAPQPRQELSRTVEETRKQARPANSGLPKHKHAFQRGGKGQGKFGGVRGERVSSEQAQPNARKAPGVSFQEVLEQNQILGEPERKAV